MLKICLTCTRIVGLRQWESENTAISQYKPLYYLYLFHGSRRSCFGNSWRNQLGGIKRSFLLDGLSVSWHKTIGAKFDKEGFRHCLPQANHTCPSVKEVVWCTFMLGTSLWRHMTHIGLEVCSSFLFLELQGKLKLLTSEKYLRVSETLQIVDNFFPITQPGLVNFIHPWTRLY